MHTHVFALAVLVGVAQTVVVLKEQAYIRLPNRSNNYAINTRTARESAYDDQTKFLYVIGYETSMLHVLSVDPSLPDQASQFYQHNFDVDVDGRPLDVELCRSGSSSYLAITFDGQRSAAFEGHLVMYDLFTDTSSTLTPKNPQDPRLTVGAHPDNMKFDSTCSRLVISNEGEPRVVEGIFYDPEGSVSIVTLSGDLNPPVTTLTFRKYDDINELTTLLQMGVRYWLRRDPTDPSNIIQFSQNVEPEYIAISPNGGFAYITLQENNAIARIDLENGIITSMYAMGNKSWELFDIDASDADNGIVMAPRKISSMYMPDKIAFFMWNEIPYLVTTDEGKTTALPGTTFTDHARANSLNWNVNDNDLDSELGSNADLGRLYVSSIDGFDVTPNVPYAFGGRGFSIWNTQSMTRSWESGDELERYTRQYFPDTFNGDCSSFSQTPVQQRDTRSTWSGPELSAVATGEFDGRSVMIFGSGRNGVLYVYTLQPTASTPTPEFQSIHRAGRIDATWTTLYNQLAAGDAIISDIKMSGNMVMVTSEVSGSVSVYTLANEQWPPRSQDDEEE